MIRKKERRIEDARDRELTFLKTLCLGECLGIVARIRKHTVAQSPKAAPQCPANAPHWS